MIKSHKKSGITLIALIITIIVLLILAGISIAMVVGEDGVINNSEKASIETRGAGVEEEVKLWKGDKKTGEMLNEDTSKFLTRDELIEDQLKRKMLTDKEATTAKKTGKVKIGSRTIDYGEEKRILASIEVFDADEIGIDNINVNAVIKNSKNKIIQYFIEEVGNGFNKVSEEASAVDESRLSYKYLNLKSLTTYNLKIVVVNEFGEEEVSKIISVKTKRQPVPLYEIAKAGNYVEYIPPSGKDQTKKIYVVLYDAKDTKANNTVEIISSDVVESVTIGNGTLQGSINGYNNAITTLKDAAKKYIVNGYASDARCVGSLPSNGGVETTSEYCINTSYSYSNKFSGKLLKDESPANYLTDFNKMKTLGIHTGTKYWLASRRLDLASYGSSFDIYYGGGSTVNSEEICYFASYSNGDKYYSRSAGLRPVIKMLNTVMVVDGEGTKDKPYILSDK